MILLIHSSYIIHLSNEPPVWIFVQSESPMFPGLKERHGQWKIEQWVDWILTRARLLDAHASARKRNH